MDPQPQLNFWQRNKLVIKSFFIAFLVLALLKAKVVFIFALLLSTLYLFIYVLIQMVDNALLFGSIGLFVLLATAMYLSRKIDWYGMDRKTNTT